MTPYYTIKDHLGSVRTIVNASGTVVERNDYYPFGSRTTFGNTYATLASNRQKFSGKEEQTAVAGSTLPYLDFGARMYDAKLVRWNTYDPMAEKYYGINPYVISGTIWNRKPWSSATGATFSFRQNWRNRATACWQIIRSLMASCGCRRVCSIGGPC